MCSFGFGTRFGGREGGGGGGGGSGTVVKGVYAYVTWILMVTEHNSRE